ncbi:hypothetical protein ACW7BJ_28030 [Azospirillum argentinense]
MQGAPVTFYIDLEPGELADIEVVARSSLAFASAVREIAYIIDPSTELRISIASGTEGSLTLNSFVDFAKNGRSKVKKALWAIVVVCAASFAQDLREALIERLMKSEDIREVFEVIKGYTGIDLTKDESGITDDDAKRIGKQVVEILKNASDVEAFRPVFREVLRDDAIRGVGVGIEHGERPQQIVPRERFHEFATSSEINDLDGGKRTKKEPVTVRLISPVLLHGDRKWKFTGKDGEFSASIKDLSFLEDALSGRHPIPMVYGVEMDIILQTVEEKEDGLWKPTDRKVIDVLEVRPPITQAEMQLSSSKVP